MVFQTRGDRLPGFFLAIVAIVTLLGWHAAAHSDELRIGYVNIERIMRESAAAKEAEGHLTQQFARRDKDLQDLGAQIKGKAEKYEKDGPVTSESDRARQQRDLQDLDRDYQRRRRELQEDINQRRNEELQQLLEKAQRAVRQIAEQEHYDLILQDAVYFAPRIDITDKVLKILDSSR